MLFGQFLATGREVTRVFREFGARQHGMRTVVAWELGRSNIYVRKYDTSFFQCPGWGVCNWKDLFQLPSLTPFYYSIPLLSFPGKEEPIAFWAPFAKPVKSTWE